MMRSFPFKITEQRLVIGFAAFAVLGLLIAGHSLFTARGTTTFIVPPEAAATVNGVTILRDDFESGMLALYEVDAAHATKMQRDEVLNGLIREELYVQRARELDVASFDSDVRNFYQKATQNFLAAKALLQRVGEGPLKEHYGANKAKFATEGAMDVADFVFPQSAAPGGEVAAAIATAHGAPESAVKFGGMRKPDTGPAFYYAAHARLGDVLFAAARGLASGAVSAPIAQPDGVHVLYMIANEPPSVRPFEDVRLLVQDDYNLRDELRAEAGDDSALRRGADIKIAEDLK